MCGTLAAILCPDHLQVGSSSEFASCKSYSLTIRSLGTDVKRRTEFACSSPRRAWTLCRMYQRMLSVIQKGLNATGNWSEAAWD